MTTTATTRRSGAAGRPGAGPRDFGREARMLRTDQLRFHPRQLRTAYTGLEALAASIAAEGVLEPLLAHRRWITPAGQPVIVELLAGHRRKLAAEMAGLARVPVTIRARVTDDEALYLQLGENQKAPLSAAEQQTAITSLHHEFCYDLPEIADRLGLDLATVRALYDGHDVAPAPTTATPSPPRPRRAKPRVPRPAVPKIRPTTVHQLITGWDHGQLSTEQLIGELRGLLGDWTPTTRADTTSARGPGNAADSTGDPAEATSTRGNEPPR